MDRGFEGDEVLGCSVASDEKLADVVAIHASREKMKKGTAATELHTFPRGYPKAKQTRKSVLKINTKISTTSHVGISMLSELL